MEPLGGKQNDSKCLHTLSNVALSLPICTLSPRVVCGWGLASVPYVHYSPTPYHPPVAGERPPPHSLSLFNIQKEGLLEPSRWGTDVPRAGAHQRSLWMVCGW
jgi:hypothetical protein